MARTLGRCGRETDSPGTAEPAGCFHQCPRILISLSHTSRVRLDSLAARLCFYRSNGLRAHAGCDLYFEKGTWIHAIGDGTVTRGPYPFYRQTFALEVDHGDFLARYGEIQAKTTVKEGDTVLAGEQIATVGTLGRCSSPKRYVALGAVRQECFGTADNHGCGQIKEKIGRHSVYASKGLNRSYCQTQSVAGSAPASLGAKV
jgi:hypothetical protein